MKQIPNIFTLLNLVCGCIAIMYIMQSGLVPQYTDETGAILVNIPEQMQMASLFIAAAGVIDFLDGFVARLMRASSEMGKQLDSLADVVSFGVAPGMIIFQFLRLAYAGKENGLTVSTLWLLPAFIIPAAGAYRLARFNIDTEQSYGFKGVPIPAAGLLIASFPLIAFLDFGSSIPGLQSINAGFIHLLANKWFLYIFIVIISWLMVSTLPMMALKFKNVTVKDNWPKYLLVVITIIAGIFLQWLAVPLVFIVYDALSLLIKPKAS